MRLTESDHEILEALACKVRVISIDQVARHWFAHGATPARHARRRMSMLADHRFVERREVLAEPELVLTHPIVAWQPGDPDPDFGAVAYRLVTRWPEVAPGATTVFLATRVTNNRYGGPPRAKPFRDDQATHDLHLTAVYLKFLTDRPRDAATWVGEDLREKAGYGLKDPDAFCEREDGEPYLLVEFGGRYDRKHVQEFHEDCRFRERRYELW